LLLRAGFEGLVADSKRVWVVRAQPIVPVEGSELEARDGKGAEVDYPEGSIRDV